MEKKAKLTLEQKINKRIPNIKQPSNLIYWGYHFLAKNIVGRKYHPEIEYIDDIRKTTGPAFVIYNHLSRIDHLWLVDSIYPRKMNILAGANEFYRSHLQLVFKLNQVIPKKIFNDDLTSFRGMRKIINDGGIIAFAPEGMSSIYGCNQPVVPGTGHFLKHYGIPVYFLQIRGSYCAQNKVCLQEKTGPIKLQMRLLFSPEDLKNLSEEEINDRVNLANKHDEYLWCQENNLTYKGKGFMTKNLEDICYKCPKCGSELTMKTEGDKIWCSNCGNGALMNEHYAFEPFNKDCVIPKAPTKWVEYERIETIKAIRKDPNYSFEVKVKIGCLDPYKYIRKKKTTNLCGEGILKVDHNGIHFVGQKMGKEFNFDLDYKKVYSLVITTDVTYFSLYVNGDFHDFYPETRCVGKILLLVEEMHRLHVNTWKNLPWNDFMHQNLD